MGERSNRRPSHEQKMRVLDDQKRRYKEHHEKQGREVSSRELERRFNGENGVGARNDRKMGW